MMMTNFLSYLFLNLIFITIGLTEMSYIFQWVMLELSMMSFIPLLINKGSFSSTQSSMKYFISQSPVSLWILMSMMVMNISMMKLLITPALLFKLGLPPFHGWVISLSESIKFKELSVIITVQKFIPLNMSMMILNMKLLILSTVMFLLIIILFSNSLSSMKLIMVITSIGGVYWPLLSQNTSSVWLEFMFIYSATLFMLMEFMNQNSLSRLKDLVKQSFNMKLLLMMFLLSMGGIPPFSGFFIKLILIKNMIYHPLSLILVIMTSFLILYLYMSIFSMSLLNNYSIFCYNKYKKSAVMLFFLSPAPVVLLSLI